MEQRINIAELLKDCPKGMELDCTMYDNVEFDYVEQSPESTYPIHCLMKTNGGYNALVFTYNGCNDRHPNAKCVIYPKGKTTWEGFVPPCQFKTGDVIYVRGMSNWIAIYKENIYNRIYDYVSINVDNESTINRDNIDNIALIDCSVIRDIRLATEEEKQKLFDAIKANGYKWNAETKTLEKLVEPRFKVGDRIQDENGYKVKITEVNLEDECYGYESIIAKGIGGIPFKEQDNWELVPNKFDINTLKPFESRVLVRTNNGKWIAAFYSHYDEDSSLHYCVVGGLWYAQCIPYEGNEHLLGTTNDCDEFFKIWE